MYYQVIFTLFFCIFSISSIYAKDLNDLELHLKKSKWRIIHKTHDIYKEHQSKKIGSSQIVKIRSLSVKQKYPILKTRYFPRFRVDEFYLKSKNHTISFPQGDYLSKGYNYSRVIWKYHYVFYQKFYVSKRGYVVYTDASIFEKELKAFVKQLKKFFH